MVCFESPFVIGLFSLSRVRPTGIYNDTIYALDITIQLLYFVYDFLFQPSVMEPQIFGLIAKVFSFDKKIQWDVGSSVWILPDATLPLSLKKKEEKIYISYLYF